MIKFVNSAHVILYTRIIYSKIFNISEKVQRFNKRIFFFKVEWIPFLVFILLARNQSAVFSLFNKNVRTRSCKAHCKKCERVRKSRVFLAKLLLKLDATALENTRGAIMKITP